MPEEIVGRVLRLVGYRACRWEFQEEPSRLTLWVREGGSRPFYTCSGCGIGTERVHSARERRVRDLPWGPGRSRWSWRSIACTAGGAGFLERGSSSSRGSIPKASPLRYRGTVKTPR